MNTQFIKKLIVYFLLAGQTTLIFAQTKDLSLEWATYLGSPASDFTGNIKVDKTGKVILASIVEGSGAPVSSNPYQMNYGGGLSDVLLTKMDGNGGILWSTYFGGNGEDGTFVLTTDSEDAIILSGYTSSTNKIASTGAHKSGYSGNTDGFLAKFDQDGTLLWATYFGGLGYDEIGNVTTDSARNIYTIGFTQSTSGIATDGAFKKQKSSSYDAFLSKFSPEGVLLWSTYYGGSGDDFLFDVCIDQKQDIYAVGRTTSTLNIATDGAFQGTNAGREEGLILKFSKDGERLWSTFYGGDESDELYACRIDSENHLIVIGPTQSQDLNPTFVYTSDGHADYNISVSKFTSQGDRTWCSLFGGNDWDTALGIDINEQNEIYIAGMTQSTDIPTTSNAYNETYNGHPWDALFIKLASDGAQEWSTYFGGNDNDRGIGIAVDSAFIYASINTSSPGLATPGSQQTELRVNDSMVLKFLENETVSNKEFLLVQPFYPVPNPTLDRISFDLNTSDPVKVTIFDTQGKLVLSVEAESKSAVDVKQLIPGNYFIHLKSEANYYKGQFVKQ